MLLRKVFSGSISTSRVMHLRFISQSENIVIFCNHLGISKEKVQYIQIKQPYLKKINEDEVKNMINAVHEIGYPKDVLVNYPNLFSMLPITLMNRYKVLEECGFQNIRPDQLLSYLTIMKQKTIGELKQSGVLPPMLNLENKLASCMTQWPTSLTSLIYEDVNLITLYELRIKIIQRYLELMLDLSNEEFDRGLKTYPTIKHRPLQAINEILVILQSQMAIPNDKIKSNLYLIHVDPDNLKKILYDIRTLGGIDVKEVIRMYPKIATKNYSTLFEIKKVLEKHGLKPEAQARCLQIFTLSPKTVDERIEHAKTTPEFSIYINHPRFLKMIYFNKTVLKRMIDLQNNNKKCLSLNILSGSSARYELFEKAPGDRLGKGKDLIFTISQLMENKYSKREIRNTLRRHPFWINIPLIEVKYAYDKLSKQFSKQDIFENCAILLYPWYKINEALGIINGASSINSEYYLKEHLNLSSLTKSQKLSLVLYIVEKKHYFSGNGVWTEEQKKNIAHLTDSKMGKDVQLQI
ncbi:transcription termination factor 5, mitochondrial-like [Zerene cesonia]|uniref:transcription termination factor 5, mitochondrial-like n=1 Tax=Zerene cesonia TaxID=33412 RepID=UPI0018E4F73D|nr:transcription termination factor 5, mitochondrial-like [Zerene cesonia]